MDWSRYHRYIGLSLNSNWFCVFRFSWYVIFSVYCKYWCRFLANFFNFMLKDWSISFWNNFKWNICFRSNFKSIDFTILIDKNFTFDCGWIFHLMNWNVNNTGNYNLLMSLICDWLIKFSINIDCS